MTVKQLQELLNDVWNRKISADEAWEIIDSERTSPGEYGNERWLPIE